MNFELTGKLPSECLVAVSGGVDSMSVLHWLLQVRGRVKGVVHFHHNTGDFADTSQDLVVKYSFGKSIPCYIRKNKREVNNGDSLEDHWREQRYRWFKEISSVKENIPIILAHNLNDCIEEYIMCSMVRGFHGTIPYRHGPCIRPFRLWEKEDIRAYADKNSIPYMEDPANKDTAKFKRAYIRHEVMPTLKGLNPGLSKLVKKIVKQQDDLDKVKTFFNNCD